MRLFIDGKQVAILDVVDRAGGKSVALDVTNNYAIVMDDLEDRTRTDALLSEAAQVHGFVGTNGVFYARWIDKTFFWGVYADGANRWYRTGMDRTGAIDLAFQLAYSKSGLA